MEWESSLLGRKIGRLATPKPMPDPDTARKDLASREQEAENSQFDLLVARVRGDDFGAIWALEASRFILVDVGVTFRYDLAVLQTAAGGSRNTELPAIREATIADIPALQEMATGLFLTSYYYVSPFFSRDEANRLFQAWISNAVRGEIANRVLVATLKSATAGFVTCRVHEDKTGSIDLIGVDRRHVSRGIGKILTQRALGYFSDLEINGVTVRTQITNVPSVNLSLSLGSRLSSADVTFMKKGESTSCGHS